MDIVSRLSNYLKEETTSTEEKIIDFFSNNPNPKDGEIHKFAETEGIDVHKFEEIVYRLLGAFLSNGRSKGFKGEIDKDELNKGIKIEMEHTDNKLIAKRIVMDHLAEIPDYYTRLIKMEKESE